MALSFRNNLSFGLEIILQKEASEYTLSLYRKQKWDFPDEPHSLFNYFIVSPSGKYFDPELLKDNICCFCTDDDFVYFEKEGFDHDDSYHDEVNILTQKDAHNLYNFIERKEILSLSEYFIKK